MEWYFIPLVILAGFIAGFIYTLAGSGSLVTLPLLIFMGLPATVANGTNRVGVLVQNIFSLESFRRNDVLDWRGSWTLGLPAVVGSIIGAQIAVDLNEELMRHVIGVVMVIMLVVILLQPNRWLEGTLDNIEKRPTLWQILLFFTIGIYGGFIQAGVGIFLLSGLVLNVGYNLVRANAVKVGIIFLFTLAALGVFIFSDQVNWLVGFVLAIGNMFGGWIAAKLAIRRGATWVRTLLLVVIIVSAANLLGLFDLIKTLF
ncbi:MAG: sulfite exporter TauE/SafE family protein [Anaerolineales bacterium]